METGGRGLRPAPAPSKPQCLEQPPENPLYVLTLCWRRGYFGSTTFLSLSSCNRCGGGLSCPHRFRGSSVALLSPVHICFLFLLERNRVGDPTVLGFTFPSGCRTVGFQQSGVLASCPERRLFYNKNPTCCFPGRSWLLVTWSKEAHFVCISQIWSFVQHLPPPPKNILCL